MSVSTSISDDVQIHRKNSLNRFRDVATGVCATRTKQSKPIYSYIKHFSSENGNETCVTNIDKARMHTGKILSHECSLNSLVEDDIELEKLIEFHGNASEKENSRYYESEIPLSSSEDSDTFSHVSWLDPKFASEEVSSHENFKDWSEHSIESDALKQSRVLDADYEIRISIQETPKRVHLKPFDSGIKVRRKPIRLANLTRKTRTKDKDEVKITKKDIKILDPISDHETFDIKKYLAKTRRKLSFPLGDSFETLSSSMISTKLLVDSNITKDSSEASDLSKLTATEDSEYLKKETAISDEPSGTFFLKDYLSKLKGIADKPPTTKRSKAFQQRTSPKTYFDFDDYCKKIFNLKQKIINEKNINKTI